MNNCLTVLQALAANQCRLQVRQFLGRQYGLTEGGVEAACHTTTFSRLVAERHFNSMYDQRTAGTIHSPAVLRVQLLECLHQQNTAFSFHLTNNEKCLVIL